MGKSDSTSIAFGGTLLGIGGGGLVALLIFRATPDAAWHHPWFFVALGVTVTLTLIGAWFLASVYTPLPTPRTRNERAKLRTVTELAVKLYEANTTRRAMLSAGTDIALAQSLVDVWEERVIEALISYAPIYLPDFTSAESAPLKHYFRLDGAEVSGALSEHIGHLDVGVKKLRRILEKVRSD